MSCVTLTDMGSHNLHMGTTTIHLQSWSKLIPSASPSLLPILPPPRTQSAREETFQVPRRPCLRPVYAPRRAPAITPRRPSSSKSAPHRSARTGGELPHAPTKVKPRPRAGDLPARAGYLLPLRGPSISARRRATSRRLVELALASSRARAWLRPPSSVGRVLLLKCY